MVMHIPTDSRLSGLAPGDFPSLHEFELALAREVLEGRIDGYKKVMSLPRLKKQSQGKKGKGLLPEMKKLSKKYNIPLNTMQFWYYNHQIPDVMRVGTKIINK